MDSLQITNRTNYIRQRLMVLQRRLRILHPSHVHLNSRSKYLYMMKSTYPLPLRRHGKIRHEAIEAHIQDTFLRTRSAASAGLKMKTWRARLLSHFAKGQPVGSINV